HPPRTQSSPYTLPSVFSPSSPVAPPLLPSFPTRRSSDLPAISCISLLDVFPIVVQSLGSAHILKCSKLEPLTINHLIADWRPVRSEEHTSELQSRFDLVCRLLLEKKNTHFNTVSTLVDRC